MCVYNERVGIIQVIEGEHEYGKAVTYRYSTAVFAATYYIEDCAEALSSYRRSPSLIYLSMDCDVSTLQRRVWLASERYVCQSIPAGPGRLRYCAL